MAAQTSHSKIDLGTVMFVGAHPDDETFCAGGLLYSAAQQGNRVVCVTATHGEKGVKYMSQADASRIVPIRTQELHVALEILGVSEHFWLSCRDGSCQDCADGGCFRELETIVRAMQPDSIVTFSPDGLTGHPDHVQVSRWVDQAIDSLRISGKTKVYHVVLTADSWKAMKVLDDRFDVFWNVDKPLTIDRGECDVVMDLDEACLAAKIAALEAMPSQTTELLNACDAQQLREVFGTEAFVSSPR